MKHSFLLLFCLSLLTGNSCVDAQKPDLKGVEIITHHVSGNIYMLEATKDVAGNIGVSIGEDGILIIDTQWEELHDLIMESLSRLDTGRIKFIINTHHHDDHMEGNAILSGVSDAIIIAHNNTRERLMGWDEDFLPSVTFNDSLTLFFNNEEIRLFSFPGGHSDNDIIIIFTESNVIHLGDLLNSGKTSFPTADNTAGGNAFNLVNILEAILPLIPEDAKIIAGHGPLSNKNDLEQTYYMVKATTEFVGSRLDKGISLDEIIEEGLPEKYKEWGYGYTGEKEWIRMIFNSYQQ